MAQILAFDVYGTLVDTAGVTELLRFHLGERAPAFAQRWRDKQLEYSFRRALMGRYAPFCTCTREALEFTCESFGTPLSAAVREGLMGAYEVLPAFADAAPALERLAAAGHRLFAFSNGPAADVTALLDHAGLTRQFEGIVSVEAVESFKPDPAVYAHFLHETGARSAWLVSGNPFDVIGAIGAGWRSVWVRRTPEAPFDPWGVTPTAVVGALTELPDVLDG